MQAAFDFNLLTGWLFYIECRISGKVLEAPSFLSRAVRLFFSCAGKWHGGYKSNGSEAESFGYLISC